MFATGNDLPEKTRAAMCDLLNARLADCIDLGRQIKQAHWNVKGPNFIALHELFDEVYDVVEEFTDELAERSVQLGGTADGTLQQVAKRTSLPAYPTNASAGETHVAALAKVLSTFGKSVRANIDAAGTAGDADTADLFTEVSRGIDKQLWFIESHLQ
jgi:starvation-inducible DNA-binding protein